MKHPHLLLGRVVVVFDSYLWTKAGGDIGNNSWFWRLANVIAVHGDDGTVDVQFIGDNRVSHGHFISAIEYSAVLEEK